MRHLIFAFFLATVNLVNTAALCQDGCTNPNALNFNPLALVDDGSCIYDDGECTEYEYIDLSWAYNPNFDPESVVVRLVNENAFYEFDGSIVGRCVLPGCYTLTVLDLSCDGPSDDPFDECDDLIHDLCDDLFDQFDGATLILEGMEYEAGCFLPAVYEVVIGSGCTGCTDPLACNYSLGATSDDGSCIASGCTDSYACNFATDAACDDGSCDYTCCPGPGCCTEGMYWDWELSGCYNINPADINLDGCVQLNDLLDLLSAYGDCGAEESTWQCGEPLDYQGYDYVTVQIGEQCWFVENLRSENYENGDAIPSNVSDSEWSSTTSGAVALYGEDAGCQSNSPDIDACDPAQSLNEYGRLYNWYAVDDSRGLCPSGWHVPTDEEWTVMTDHLGGESISGGQMKTTYGWFGGGNGMNLAGFSGLPGGYRYSSGYFGFSGFGGNWWSSSPDVFGAWGRGLNYSDEAVSRNNYNPLYGFSVRCIKDSE